MSQRQKVCDRLDGRSAQRARRGFFQVEPNVVVLQDQSGFVDGSGTDKKACCCAPLCWMSGCWMSGCQKSSRRPFGG